MRVSKDILGNALEESFFVVVVVVVVVVVGGGIFGQDGMKEGGARWVEDNGMIAVII